MNSARPRIERRGYSEHDRADDQRQRDRPALAHRQRLALRLCQLLTGGLADLLPRCPRRSFSASCSRPWMNSQRGLSGTLRRTNSTARPMIAPSTNDSRQPTFDGKDRGVEQHHRQQRAADATEPVAAVDRHIDAAALAGRDQLVDRGVDRAVLSADAHAGDETGREEPARGERQTPSARCRSSRSRA